VALCDADSDNLSDAVENAGLNGGDGNRDSVPDSQQANVTSLVTAPGAQATLSSASGASLLEVYSADLPAGGTKPQGVSFPLGSLGFGVAGSTVSAVRVKTLSAGGAETITRYLPPGTGINTYWAYGPTTDNSQAHWYEFLFDGATGAEIFTDRIVLHLTDGGRGDDDLAANGEIVHAGSPGFFTGVAVSPDQHDFGSVEIADASSFQTFTLTNLTTGPLSIGEAVLSGTGAAGFSILNNACSGSAFSAGGACTLDVLFSPLAEGWKEALATVSVSGEQAAVSIGLSGQAGLVHPFTLTVVRAGSGEGTVTSAPAGIDCGSLCSAAFPSGENVSLTATALPGSLFTGWSGACFGKTLPCVVLMDRSRDIVANFGQDIAPVGTVVINGGDAHTTDPAVTLTLSCSGVTACVNMAISNDKDFSSQYGTTLFSAQQATGAPDTSTYGDRNTAWAPQPKNGTKEYLTLEFATPVYADGATIRETYGNGFVYQVDALDENGELHNLWVGTDPSQSGAPADFAISFPRTGFLTNTIKIYVDTDHNSTTWEEIDAVQLRGYTVAERFLLNVAKTGSGTGRVFSAAAGIDCGDICFGLYDEGTAIVLTALVDAESIFSGWQGGCAGTEPCSVTLSGNTSVTAVFDASSVSACKKGDLGGDGIVGIDDAVLALQLAAAREASGVFICADANEDGKIGLEEVVYILQKTSGIRP